LSTHPVNSPAQTVHVAHSNYTGKDHTHSPNKARLSQDLNNKYDNNLAIQLRNSRLDRERKKSPTSPKRRDIIYKNEPRYENKDN